MFDVNKIREDFPILKREINGNSLVYLDSAATSQKPKQVIDKIVEFYENNNANIHRGVHTLSVEATEMVDSARKKVAKFINAKPEEIIFVRNASEAINLVAYAWLRRELKEGEVVVTSVMEHHSDLVTWQEIVKEKKGELRFVGIDGEGRLDLKDLEKKLDGKVRLVAVTAVSNVLGTINSISSIKNLVSSRAPGALILIDGAQSVPHMPTDVTKMGVDFLAFSGHKMLGPTGVGVLLGKKEILEKMEPFMYGGDMIGEVKLTGSIWAELPNKFEAGTPDICGIIALGEAVDYLTKLGMENVREHEKDLIKYALEKMKPLEEKGLVTIYGPRDPEERGGVLTFNVNGIHAHDSAQVLDKYGIAVRSGQHCGAPLVEIHGVSAMARASFYVYTTKEEIDYLVEKIQEIPKVFKI